MNALRNAKFDLATSSDRYSDDEDEKEDKDADVVQVTKSSIKGDDEQEDWLEWEDLGNHDEDDDDEDSLVDVGNPGITNSNPTKTNLNNKNKTASIYINNHVTVQDIPDMTNLNHKTKNKPASICIHNHGILQNNPDVINSNPTTTNLNNKNTASIYIHNHGIVQDILDMTNSNPTTTILNHNNSRNKKDVASIYIHNHGIVQDAESFAPPLSYTTTKLPKECSTNRIHNYHSHNNNSSNGNVNNVSPSPLGQSLSQIAISDLSHAGIYVSTPLAALALAIHSALCSHVLNFKCTGIPDATHTNKKGFASPARVLPRGKCLPDGWDRRANACLEVGKQRYHNQYRYNTNIDIDNHMVSLRYCKEGMGVVLLHIEMLSPHGYDDEDVCTHFTTARIKSKEEVNRAEFRVRLRFGQIEGEPTVMTFPLNRHVNLDGFSAINGDGVKLRNKVQPAFYYKALATLMTEFCKVMDLGAVQETSLLTENDESISSKITGVVVGNDTSKIDVAAPHSRKTTSSLSQSVVGIGVANDLERRKKEIELFSAMANSGDNSSSPNNTTKAAEMAENLIRRKKEMGLFSAMANYGGGSGSPDDNTTSSFPITKVSPLLSITPPTFKTPSRSGCSVTLMKSRASPRLDAPTGREMGGRKTCLHHLDEPIGIDDDNDNHNDRFQPQLRLRQPKIRLNPTDGEGNITNVLSTKQRPQLLDDHRTGGSDIGTGNSVGLRHPTFWQSDYMEDDEEVGGGVGGSPSPSNNGGW